MSRDFLISRSYAWSVSVIKAASTGSPFFDRGEAARFFGEISTLFFKLVERL
jgi:hypothetical protein